MPHRLVLCGWSWFFFFFKYWNQTSTASEVTDRSTIHRKSNVYSYVIRVTKRVFAADGRDRYFPRDCLGGNLYARPLCPFDGVQVRIDHVYRTRYLHFIYTYLRSLLNSLIIIDRYAISSGSRFIRLHYTRPYSLSIHPYTYTRVYYTRIGRQMFAKHIILFIITACIVCNEDRTLR
jgi:hypothetical protein